MTNKSLTLGLSAKVPPSFIKTVGWAVVAATALVQSAHAAQLLVPGFGPGIAGNVSEGPTTPVCEQGVPCTRPFANAIVQILDEATRVLVGKAETNSSGDFIVSVPDGKYVVHIMTVDFPFCPEQTVTVTGLHFPLTQINCDTVIR